MGFGGFYFLGQINSLIMAQLLVNFIGLGALFSLLILCDHFYTNYSLTL